MLHPAFRVHMLSPEGIQKANQLAEAFDGLLSDVEDLAGGAASPESGRYLAIVTTKLEEACFFAKKALAVNPENQKSS